MQILKLILFQFVEHRLRLAPQRLKILLGKKLLMNISFGCHCLILKWEAKPFVTQHRNFFNTFQKDAWVYQLLVFIYSFLAVSSVDVALMTHRKDSQWHKALNWWLSFTPGERNSNLWSLWIYSDQNLVSHSIHTQVSQTKPEFYNLKNFDRV